jgi:hypothetical protein
MRTAGSQPDSGPITKEGRCRDVWHRPSSTAEHTTQGRKRRTGRCHASAPPSTWFGSPRLAARQPARARLGFSSQCLTAACGVSDGAVAPDPAVPPCVAARQAWIAAAGDADRRSAKNAAAPHGSIARSAPLDAAASPGGSVTPLASCREGWHRVVSPRLGAIIASWTLRPTGWFPAHARCGLIAAARPGDQGEAMAAGTTGHRTEETGHRTEEGDDPPSPMPHHIQPEQCSAPQPCQPQHVQHQHRPADRPQHSS